MKKRSAQLRALLALAGIAAVAVAALLTAPSAAGLGASSTVYRDAVGDVGDAPDVARVTIRPVVGGLAVDVMLARPTRLGPYGWILFGVDTDRDGYTGGGRGDELLLMVNGEGATFMRWIGRHFSPDFVHRDVEAAFSGIDLTFVLSWADIGARSFDFSVATLREDADLAPGFGIATYPRTRAARAVRGSRRGLAPERLGELVPGNGPALDPHVPTVGREEPWTE